MRDVVIIGAGQNGLVTAALLAKAGLKPLVLERAERVGGIVITSELTPGFRCPTLAHRVALDPQVIAALGLESRHGLKIVRPAAICSASTPEHRRLTLWSDTAQTAVEIRRFSKSDGDRYPDFVRAVAGAASFVRRFIDRPRRSRASRSRNLIDALGIARRFRALGRSDAYRLLRWVPMPVADLVRDWFDTELLSASIAAGALFGSFAGPRSPGTGGALLMLSVGDGHPVPRGWTAVGGVGAVTEALADSARSAGAEIRLNSSVQQIVVKNGAAQAIVLANGDEIEGNAIVSAADPKHTLLGLLDPTDLSPEFARLVKNLRMRGTLAKVNFAVDCLPEFVALRPLDAEQRRAVLSGCIRIGPTIDYLERAFDAMKYGGYATDSSIELTIPSVADPSLAPEGQHVVSAYVQFTPHTLRGSTWDVERDRLGDVAARTIDAYAPGFSSTIVGRQVITPLDLEHGYGLTGGHLFHGELALDQLFDARPLVGWSHYRTPIQNLFLCGAGTFPGTVLDGRSGKLAAREILSAMRSRTSG